MLSQLRLQTLAYASLLALALAAPSPETSDVSAFVAKERPIALQGALNNIGPDGIDAAGAGPGYVVASPSKNNPDYYYTWTRDSALTLKMLIDEYTFPPSCGTDKTLKTVIENYVHAQAVLQTVSNPSGTFLPAGTGLGEPKFNVNGTAFTGAWGRPQRDGPALRAIALMEYSWHVLDMHDDDDDETTVGEVYWPIIQNDLSYVGQYWNSTGFDLWEEVLGSSFFTTQNQYRALVEGAQLAKRLGKTCKGCDEQAAAVGCFLGTYWNGKWNVANVNVQNNQRVGIDANTVLGPISVFDVAASCTDTTLQPCHAKSLATFKVFVDTFRNASLYPINDGIAAGHGVALGRYPEDIYYNGNPWYLITLGAAEFLYDAIAQWKAQCQIVIDTTSLPFFQEIYPGATAQTYKKTHHKDPFHNIITATKVYADSFVAVAEKYTPANGSLSEQFNKTLPGNPLSAYALTWSFASFVTMAQRRAGQFPRGWTSSSLPTTPATCVGSSTPGTYIPAIAAGAPNITAECTSTILFVVNATTYFGENVYVVGNTTDLGNWDVTKGVGLGAGNYTAQRPEWFAQVPLKAGESVTYAYARQENCGQPWVVETVNRTLVVPACEGSSAGAADGPIVVTDDVWTGPVGKIGTC